MKKKSVFIILGVTLAVSLFLTITIVEKNGVQADGNIQKQSQGIEEEQSEKKIRSQMNKIKKSNAFDKVANELKANGHKIISSSSVQFTPEYGFEFLIEVPKSYNNPNSNKEIKKIVNNTLNKSDISEINLSVKIIPMDIKNKNK